MFFDDDFSHRIHISNRPVTDNVDYIDNRTRLAHAPFANLRTHEQITDDVRDGAFAAALERVVARL